MQTSTEGHPVATPVHRRIEPSVPVAIGVFIAYTVVFIGLSSTSGIAYDQWFATGGNAFRSAVLPLLGGSLVLVAFVAWARWDGVFRDPFRLPWYGVLWIPVGLFLVGIVVHLTGVDWGRVPADLLLAVLAAGVLVGFAEETLFRGVILRSLRTRHRAEAGVMVISSLWFGFFHLTNIANGSPVGKVLFQCVIASLSGVALYAFRRWRGVLLAGMIAHGLWDMSTFLPAREGSAALLNLTVMALVAVSAAIAAILVVARDRRMAVTPEGSVTIGR